MLELNKENFEDEVTNYKEKPVFVDFWGDKCEICKALMPDVEKLAEEYKDKIKFCSLNTSHSRRLAISQRVLGLPTMAIYNGGEKVETLTPDNVSLDSIKSMIKKYI